MKHNQRRLSAARPIAWPLCLCALVACLTAVGASLIFRQKVDASTSVDSAQTQALLSRELIGPAPSRLDTLRDLIANLGASEARGRISKGEVRLSVSRETLPPQEPGLLAHLALAWQGGLDESALRASPESWEWAVADLPARPLRGGSSPSEVGSVTASFESGHQGSLAVGHSSAGGTCYGTYQIASRTGTFTNFVKFLEQKAPHLARRLTMAGPADAGASGGSMAEEWRRITAEQGRAFENLQHQFIVATHYKPAAREIREATGIDVERMSAPLREALLSASVQHGPGGAVSIFTDAARRVQAGGLKVGSSFEQALLERVYASRTSYVNGAGTRMAAYGGRYEREKNLLLGLLGTRPQGSGSQPASAPNL